MFCRFVIALNRALLRGFPACSSALEPAAVLQSGETITVETATHHAGDDYNKVSARPEPVKSMHMSGL